MMDSRLENLKKELLAQNIPAALISSKSYLQYFCGLSPTHPTEREAFLLIHPNRGTILYHSPFVRSPSTKEVTIVLMGQHSKLPQVFADFYGNTPTVGIETKNLTVAELERLHLILPQSATAPIDELLATQIRVKTKPEIRLLQQAISITTNTLTELESLINDQTFLGKSELDLAHWIRDRFEAEGASESFPTIVAFGAHSALPHHLPTQNTKLTQNQVVLIDCGAKYRGFCSDMSRTYFCGTPTPPFLGIKQIIKLAYAKAVDYLYTHPAPIACDLDQVVRSTIEQAGYGKYFIHSTGHGLGIEAHESPSISTTNEQVLTSGMVFTIEPGIYLPRRFGYRHENTIIL